MRLSSSHGGPDGSRTRLRRRIRSCRLTARLRAQKERAPRKGARCRGADESRTHVLQWSKESSFTCVVGEPRQHGYPRLPAVPSLESSVLHRKIMPVGAYPCMTLPVPYWAPWGKWKSCRLAERDFVAVVIHGYLLLRGKGTKPPLHADFSIVPQSKPGPPHTGFRRGAKNHPRRGEPESVVETFGKPIVQGRPRNPADLLHQPASLPTTEG